MSRAEDRALEYYPIIDREDYPCKELDEAYREVFLLGYHQAEKDNELTWEDIPKIFQISEQLKTCWWFRDNEQTKLIGTQVFWEEVLKRYKAQKGE